MEKITCKEIISNKGLKVTPQRIAILEALVDLANHPTVDEIIDHIKDHHPSISTGTVYKTLETMKEKGLITKVISDREVMRYDAVLEKHHHLYSASTGRIEDYHDEELNKLLESYFEKKNIKDFDVEDIKIYITGEFKDK